MVLKVLKENETIEKAVDLFVKSATWLFLGFAIIKFLEMFVGLTFDFSLGLGL